jgi:hypothetical protein
MSSKTLNVSDKALKATAALLMKYGGLSEEAALEAAPAIHKTFDLAPKGTLQPFTQAISGLARGADYKG